MARTSITIPDEIFEKIRKVSKETDIPISRLLRRCFLKIYGDKVDFDL